MIERRGAARPGDVEKMFKEWEKIQKQKLIKKLHKPGEMFNYDF